jgi:sugar (pentulose or hexulose) kinase
MSADKTNYILTIDAGRTNLHMAVYKHTRGSRLAPERVVDFPNIPNEVYVSPTTSLLTERIDETFGAVKGAIAGLPLEIRAQMGAIVIDSHGAAAHVLDKNGNPLFTQVYDHDVSGVRDAFSAACGDSVKLYLETGTPRLPLGINWLAQVAYLCNVFKEEMQSDAGQITSVAGYIASRLTGRKVGMDSTQLYNHSYAVNINSGSLSSAAQAIQQIWDVDVANLIGKVRKNSYEPVGVVGKDNPYKLAPGCKVISVAHDTSLVAEFARMAGFRSFNSSGTWSCLIAPGRTAKLRKHMQQWDYTVNADVYGEHLPTVMFRGGQMFDGYMALGGAKAKAVKSLNPDQFNIVLRSSDIFALPAFMNGAGPYKHKNDPKKLDGLMKLNPEFLVPAVHLANAFMTLFAEAAAQRPLPKDVSLVDILSDTSDRPMLVAGPSGYGLSGHILSLVNPRPTYIVTDTTPVNLAGALVGVAAIERVRPDELDIKRSSLPVEQLTPTIFTHTLRQDILAYAKRWEEAARKCAPN